MTGTQIKTQLSKIIDAMVEERLESLVAEVGQEEAENSIIDREQIIDELVEMIEFYKKDL